MVIITVATIAAIECPCGWGFVELASAFPGDTPLELLVQRLGTRLATHNCTMDGAWPYWQLGYRTHQKYLRADGWMGSTKLELRGFSRVDVAWAWGLRAPTAGDVISDYADSCVAAGVKPVAHRTSLGRALDQQAYGKVKYSDRERQTGLVPGVALD